MVNNGNKNMFKEKRRKISLYILSFIYLMNPILSKEYNNIIYYSSFITLTIKGPSTSKIFYNNYNNIYCPKTIFPDEIYINDILQSNISSEYYFNESINIVKLIYDNQLTNLNCMFYTCQNITEIDFSNFDSSNIKACGSMFNLCKSLTSINFTNFNTSQVTQMQRMFENCKALKEIDLSNFNTSNVATMEYMFQNCEAFESINLSNFDISKVGNIRGMFSYCYSLTSINLSNFNFNLINYMSYLFRDCINLKYIELSKYYTNRLQYIGSMFKNCQSLISVDLSYFKTNYVYNMDFTFYNCKSLTSLDLSNFDTSRVTWIESMFDSCSNLKYLNFQNLKEKPNPFKYDNMFRGLPDDIVICINETKAPNLVKLLKDKICHSIDCSITWNENKKIILNETNSCTYTCNNDIKYIYGYSYHYYYKCLNIFDINDINKLKCKDDLNNFILYIVDDYQQNICISCNDLFNSKAPRISTFVKTINCNTKPEGFYLNESNNNNYIYRLCYETCKDCDINGDNINHNCLLCNNNFPFSLHTYNNYFNCYISCTHYFYQDINTNIYYCMNDSYCPGEYSKLKFEKNECIKNCSLDKEYKYEFNDICYKKCPEKSISSDENKYFCDVLCNDTNPFLIIKEQICVDYCDIPSLKLKLCKVQIGYVEPEENDEKINVKNKEIKEEKEIKAQDNLIKNVEKSLTSNNYNTSGLDNGEDDKINVGKISITLTTTKNQNNSLNNTETNLNLGDCENKLKDAYNLSKDEILYIKKIEMKQEDMKIPKVEYDIYSKLNKGYLIQLNKSYCEDTKVDIYVPVILDENIDILNSSSGYYNDICYTATSDSGTDISLKDRKKAYIEKNKAVCQDDCDFTDYDYKINKAKCTCKVKETSSSSAGMKIDKQKLMNKFKDFKNLANINILVCYKVLFSLKGIKNNIGLYITASIIIIHLIFIISFYYKHLNILEDKIKDIIFALNNYDLIKKGRKQKLKIKKKIVLNKQKKINKNINKENYNLNTTKINKKTKNAKNVKINNMIINNSRNINKIENNYISINQNKSSFLTFNNSDLKNEEIKEKIEKIMSYHDQELNELEYDLVLKIDKRTYCEYYISLLKTKHLLIFSFCYNNDYNSKIIKLDLFFINFTLYFAINALFFNDDTMHKILEEKGKFQIVYQLPQIIYSSLISSVLISFLKFLALSESNIITFKNNKIISNIEQRHLDLKNKLFIKFIFFFIISTIFLLLFCFYLSMFGAIYVNTQIHLLNDTLISFGLSLVYPLFIYLLPGFFRINALSNIKNKKKYLYTISQIIQII